MRKAKAIAISAENPFGLAFVSLGNFLSNIADFMYGTGDRARYTLAFALGLVVLAGLFSMMGIGSPLSCGHDTLTGAL